MTVDRPAEIVRLRATLRDLVALSAIPSAWVGRDPPGIAVGLADVLVGSLDLEFAFVRLSDAKAGATVEATCGNGWKTFPEWLERRVSAAGPFSRKEIIPDLGGGGERRCRGIVIPVGVDAEGGLVAAACDRDDFPSEIDQLLISVAVNQAVTAFQGSRLIHELRNAEHALRQGDQELRQINKELEAFAYSVSHDLRAPLRHIGGFAELLQKQADSVPDEKSRGHIGAIVDATNRMNGLIDDLLHFSRIGRAETHHTTVDLGRVIEDVVTEIAPDTQGRKIVWRIGKLPTCNGDPSMVRLVFVNLVSNALKFTRTREQAEIDIGSLNHSANEVVVFVKDNGVGFDMKYKERLFGVFQRLHSQESFEGTGIGLATVQRIVHRHSGRVWAEGKIDNGATFYVALPKPGKINS
jgi:signal transduction histidine kinase